MVLSLLLIGLAVTLYPPPLTAFLVVLPSERGVRKGAAFTFGWLVCLAIVVIVTVLATGNSPPKPSTAPAEAALAVKIALGVVLVVIAVRHIRARGRPNPPKKPPKWQEHVDTACPLVRDGPGPGAAALGPDRRGRRHRGGGQTVQLGELPGAGRVLRAGLVLLPDHGDLRGVQARSGAGRL